MSYIPEGIPTIRISTAVDSELQALKSRYRELIAQAEKAEQEAAEKLAKANILQAFIAELDNGKKVIADAINKQGGTADGSMALEALAEAIKKAPTLNGKFADIYYTVGLRSNTAEPYDADLSAFEYLTSLQNTYSNRMIRSIKGLRVLQGLTTMQVMFRGCSSLQSVDLSGLDTSNVTSMQNMFYNCFSLQSVDLSGLDTSKVTTMQSMFNDCSSLQSVNLLGTEASLVVNVSSMFIGCISLTTLVGTKRYDAIKAQNLSVLKGLNIGLDLRPATYLGVGSALAVINGLADRTGMTTQILYLPAQAKNALSAEDIAIATAKNWTIA